MDTLNLHTIWTKNAEFCRTYIAECRNCERVIFELSAAHQMIKWNDQKLLLLKDDMIPGLLKESSGRMAPKDGPYALNIFSELACRCSAIIGLHVISANWASQLFGGKFLVRADKMKIVVIEASTIVEVGLLDEYDEPGFERYEPAKLGSTTVAKEGSEQGLKRQSRNQRRDEMTRAQVKQVIGYFAKVLGDLQQRISVLQGSCKSCMTVVQKLAKRLPSQCS